MPYETVVRLELTLDEAEALADDVTERGMLAPAEDPRRAVLRGVFEKLLAAIRHAHDHPESSR